MIWVSFLFALLFSWIGFVNTFWGNDPYFGLIIFALSFIYYLPLIKMIERNFYFVLKRRIMIVLGVLILWASLGVGELFDKIELMRQSLPFTNITGI
jgi:CDP-diglyceride synthetase